MIRLSVMLRILLALLLLLGAAAHAESPPPPSPPPPSPPSPSPPSPAALNRVDAQQVLDVLRDATKRQQLIAVLQGIATALPPPPGAAAAPAASAEPAATPAVVAKPAVALPIPLVPDSLGAEILVGASARLHHLSASLANTARVLTDFPLFARWIGHIARNPDARAEVIEAAWKLAVVMIIAVAVERAAVHLLRRPVIALAHRVPHGRPRTDAADEPPEETEEGTRLRRRPSALLLLRRLPYVLGRFALDLLPLLAVAAVGYALLGTPLGVPETARLVILAVLDAYVLTRFIVTVTRVLLSPEAPRLRLIAMSDRDAAYLLRWVRRIAIISVFGYAAAEVGLLFGLYRVAHDSLLKLVSLAVHICIAIVVLQTRKRVAGIIRARAGATGPLALLRNRLAAVWHIVALFYIMALWLVWAFDVPDGFTRLVRVFISTVLIVTLARLLNVSAVGALDRALRIEPDLAARYPGLELRARRYHPVVRAIAGSIISTVAAVVLFQAWGLDSFSWFAAGGLGGRVVSALVSIALTLLGALLSWELLNAAVQRHLARLSRDAQAARSARLRTLLPMFRTALAVTICIVAGLIVLSDIGVNIAPLLDGAGVIGLAIGFGSQKLVQDIITGLFLLMENAMQVGDVVSLGGLSGSVETLSVRTIKLRALDGSVHIVPFSAVTTVTNMTRDFSYALIDISVGLNEEPADVIEAVRDVARSLRAEPRWASAIRDDLEVLGIEKFIDLAYVLRVRIQTLPGQRWAVARELNRRIKARFDELAIESPITSHRVLSGPPQIPASALAKSAPEEAH